MLKHALTETSVPNKTRRRLSLALVPKKNNQSWISRLSFRALQVINFLAVPVALINVLRWWNSYDDTEAANILVEKQKIFLWTLGSSFVISVASSFSEKAKNACNSIALFGVMFSSLFQYLSRMIYCGQTGCDYSGDVTPGFDPYITALGFGTPIILVTLHGILRYYYKVPGSNDPTVLLTLSWNAMEIPRAMLDKTTVFQRSPYTQPPMLTIAGLLGLVPLGRRLAEKCFCTKKSVAINHDIEVKESKSCCISSSTFKKIGRFITDGRFIIVPMYVGGTLVTMAFNLFSDSISIAPEDIMWKGGLIGAAPVIFIGGVLWLDRRFIHPNQESIVQTSESKNQLAADSHMEFTSTREKSQSLAISISGGDILVAESKLPRSHSQSHLSYSPPSSQTVIISNSNGDSPPDQALVPSSKSDSPKRETDSPRSKESEKSGSKTPPSPESASSKGSTPPSPESIIKGDSPVSSSLVVKVERTRSPSPTEAAAGKKNVTVVIPSSLFFPVCSSSAVAESKARAIAAATAGTARSDFDSEPSTGVPYRAFLPLDESERPAAHAPSKPSKDRSCLGWLSCLWPGNWCGQGAAPNSEFPIPLRVADNQAGPTCSVGLSAT